MTHDTHLDGNAIGGLLYDLFGKEMTGHLGCCGACGFVESLGAAHVYREAPGDVVRCSNCGMVLLVVVTQPGGYRVTFETLRWIDM